MRRPRPASGTGRWWTSRADVTELASGAGNSATGSAGRRVPRRRTTSAPSATTGPTPPARRPGAPVLLRGARRRRADPGGRHRDQRDCGVVQPGVPHPGQGHPGSRCSRTELTRGSAVALPVTVPGDRAAGLAWRTCTSTWCRRYRLGQHDHGPGIPGPDDRHRRGRPVRRDLPERRLHPDEDVRLSGRRRRATPGAPARSACTRRSTRSTGRACGTASSAGSTRSPTVVRQYREGPKWPNLTVFSGTGRFTGHKQMAVDAERRRDRGVHRRPIRAGRRRTPGDPRHSRVWTRNSSAADAVHTSDTIMRIDDLPERLIVVGGGYIAAEFAHVFASFGTRVTQLVRGSRLLRHHDADISRHLHRARAAALRPAAGHRHLRGQTGDHRPAMGSASSSRVRTAKPPSRPTCCCSPPDAGPTPTCSTSPRPG